MYDVTVKCVTYNGKDDRIVFSGIISEAALIVLFDKVPFTPAYEWEVVHVIQDN